MCNRSKKFVYYIFILFYIALCGTQRVVNFKDSKDGDKKSWKYLVGNYIIIVKNHISGSQILNTTGYRIRLGQKLVDQYSLIHYSVYTFVGPNRCIIWTIQPRNNELLWIMIYKNANICAFFFQTGLIERIK